MRSKNVDWDIPLTSESLVTYVDLPKKKLRNKTGRNTTWVFFQSIRGFFSIKTSCISGPEWDGHYSMARNQTGRQMITLMVIHTYLIHAVYEPPPPNKVKLSQ